MWEFDQSLGDRRKNLANPPSFEEITEQSIEDSSEVPQVWRLRSEGSWTSHNGSSVNFLGDGTIFWGTARKSTLNSSGTGLPTFNRIGSNRSLWALRIFAATCRESAAKIHAMGG